MIKVVSWKNESHLCAANYYRISLSAEEGILMMLQHLQISVDHRIAIDYDNLL